MSKLSLTFKRELFRNRINLGLLMVKRLGGAVVRLECLLEVLFLSCVLSICET